MAHVNKSAGTTVLHDDILDVSGLKSGGIVFGHRRRKDEDEKSKKSGERLPPKSELGPSNAAQLASDLMATVADETLAVATKSPVCVVRTVGDVALDIQDIKDLGLWPRCCSWMLSRCCTSDDALSDHLVHAKGEEGEEEVVSLTQSTTPTQQRHTTKAASAAVHRRR